MGVRHGILEARDPTEPGLQPPRRRLLGERRQAARPDADQRRLPLVVECSNRRARPGVRQRRAHRPDPRTGPTRVARHVFGGIAAGGGWRSRDRRFRGCRPVVDPATDRLSARRCTRLRCPHRRTALDVPADSPSRRDRPRNMAGRLLGRRGRRQRLDADECGSRPRHHLPAVRVTVQRLVRRPPSRRQPVRREPGLPRGRDRQTRLVFPDRPPRPLGLRPPGGTESGRHHRRWPGHQGGGPGDQAGPPVRVRPGDGRAGLAHRGTSRTAEPGAGRAHVTDPALPDAACTVRAPGYLARQSHRLLGHATGRDARDRPKVRPWAALHPAKPQGNDPAAG